MANLKHVERAVARAQRVEDFRFPTPDAMPDEMTARLFSFRRAVYEFIHAAQRIGDSEVDAALKDVDADIEAELIEAYKLHTKLVPAIDLVRDLRDEAVASAARVLDRSPVIPMIGAGAARIDRRPWLRAKAEAEFPADFPCPYCGTQLGYPDTEELYDDAVREAIERQEEGEAAELGRVCYTISARYSCVACEGTTLGLAAETIDDFVLLADGGSSCIPVSFDILWLQPPPPLLALPEGCPVSVVHATLEACALIWHPSSCANQMRTAIELLVDSYAIPRASPNGGRLSLDARLRSLASTQPATAAASHLLMAAKWLGNDGSHGTIEISDALDLVEIWGLALQRLFGEPLEDIEAKAHRINRNRGRIT